MTTYDIRRRLDRLESQVMPHKKWKTAMLLRYLRQYGYEAAVALLQEAKSHSGRVLPFWAWMNVMDDTDEMMAFESYRGLVPDEVIRKAYSERRNWAGGSAEVRRWAGVIDEAGNVMPGYVLLENGCIVDAPLAVVG